MALSFVNYIRPLFRYDDVETMKRYGLDLSSYEEIKQHAAKIYAFLDDGSMPCEEPWPKGQVALFRKWIEGGMAGLIPRSGRSVI
jgi:hypothetical protein